MLRFLSIPGASLASLRNHCHCQVFSSPTLVVAFLVLWLLSETLRRDGGRRPQAHQGCLDLAASNLIKSATSLLVWLLWRRLQDMGPLLPRVTATAVSTPCGSCKAYLPACNEQAERLVTPRSYSQYREPCPRPGLIFGSVRSMLAILLVALAYALRAYTEIRSLQFIDSIALHLAPPVTMFGLLVFLRIVSLRKFPSSFWHAIVFQFAGFFITRDALVRSMPPPLDLLIAFSLSSLMWLFLADLIYGLHRSSSIFLINVMMFSQSCIIHFLFLLLGLSHPIPHSYCESVALAFDGLSLIEAARDMISLFIIKEYGAINQGILTSLASTLLIVADIWRFKEPPYPAFLGCLIAILGCIIFIFSGECREEHPSNLLLSTRRRFAAAACLSAILGYMVITVSRDWGSNSWVWSSARKGLSDLSGGHVDCRASESSALFHGPTIGNYTHFNDILLIVFFSHARYGANLDFHKELYGDYFPNIVYVGPASREDKGFAHSYDVLIDSFQSDEDLSDPYFYKMAGRMAHHMLYTALKEYGCYDGYFWAPFDTLLNVPRLQQFNQSLFWYHSPWGQPVLNPAFGEPTEPGLNVSRHAPPARISPDPSLNLTETWKGCCADWWWGDPHVGVPVCMDAFRNVPEDLLAHLASRNDGQVRLIGGSVDTLYIPGHRRKLFMDVLALFLETNCFLEIATPTAVHLVVSPDEPIQFVDHYWIYEPPFNASFVRQKWAQGYEVDTFHTFHFGERGKDGVWQGDHRHVADVRRLLRESAYRQGLNDTFPVNLGLDE